MEHAEALPDGSGRWASGSWQPDASPRTPFGICVRVSPLVGNSASGARVAAGGRTVFALVAALAFLALAGLTRAAPAAGAVEQMREFAQSTRSARGEFAQRTMKASGQAAESTTGVFAFAKPGRFRWEVRKPFEQLMVADGEQVWFYDKDLNQVTTRPLGDALGATPAAILFGTGDLETTFALKDLGEREGRQWLEARPKSREAGFDVIAIGLKGGLPEAMEVRDAFGRLTTFTFTGIERNPAGLDAQAFRFVVPKGAEVVRQ